MKTFAKILLPLAFSLAAFAQNPSGPFTSGPAANKPASCGTDGAQYWTTDTQILYACAVPSWYPANSGGTPGGAAGGFLSGTYPNPTPGTYATGATGAVSASSTAATLNRNYSLSGTFGAPIGSQIYCTTTTGGSATTLTCNGSSNWPGFVAGSIPTGDVGKLIDVDTVGTSGYPLHTTITAVTSGTTVTVANPAVAAVSNAFTVYGIDTNSSTSGYNQTALNFQANSYPFFQSYTGSPNGYKPLLLAQGFYPFSTALTYNLTGTYAGPNLIGSCAGQSCALLKYVGTTSTTAALGITSTSYVGGVDLENLAIEGNENATYALSLTNTNNAFLKGLVLGPADPTSGACLYFNLAITTVSTGLYCASNAGTWPSGLAPHDGIVIDNLSTQMNLGGIFVAGTQRAMWFKSVGDSVLIAPQLSSNCMNLQIDNGSGYNTLISPLLEESTCANNYQNASTGNVIIAGQFSGTGAVHMLSGAYANTTGGLMSNQTAITVDSGAGSNAFRDVEYLNTSSTISDAGTDTVFDHITSNGKTIPNFPSYQHCFTPAGAGSTVIDPTCIWEGYWVISSSMANQTQNIAPKVFVTGKAWQACFTGTWFNYGEVADSSLPKQRLCIDDQNPTVQSDSGTYPVVFSVNGSGNFQFAKVSSTNAVGFSGMIIFTPLSTVAAGSGNPFAEQLSGALVINSSTCGASFPCFQVINGAGAFLKSYIDGSNNAVLNATNNLRLLSNGTQIAAANYNSFGIGGSNQTTWNTSGLQNKDNNETVVATGHPYTLYGTPDALRTSTGTITLLTGLVGTFRVNLYTTNTGTVCTNTSSLAYTDKSGSQSPTLIAATLTTGQSSYIVNVTSGNLTLTNTITGTCTGTGFDTSIFVERLGTTSP